MACHNDDDYMYYDQIFHDVDDNDLLLGIVNSEIMVTTLDNWG